MIRGIYNRYIDKMNFTNIPGFFKDKVIFITGGSGFIGKVLIEKLLRSCPDLEVIYMLIREKKGKTIQERVDEILKNDLFDTIRQTKPALLKKVVALAGDVSLLGLGLNESDKRLVLNSNVVFHAAASVRFDDPLEKAILMNTRGTREVMELMLQMPKLVVGVYVSTTYCNTDKHVIEEKIYRDHGDWREAIRLAEKLDDDYKVACLTKKILGGLKNTYLYSKHLAENVVQDYSDRLPLLVFRPGIVISICHEPIPGWVDNWNGPASLNIAICKGILRTVYANPEKVIDYIPVDIIVKAILVATWDKVTSLSPQEQLPVYNSSVIGKLHVTQRRCTIMGLESISQVFPFRTLWYPRLSITNSITLFSLLFFFYDVVPGFIIDGILKISGNKPMLMKIMRKIYFSIMAVGYFTTTSWSFKSDQFWDLQNKLLPEDRPHFFYDVVNVDLYEFAGNELIGAGKYLLKEPFKYEEYEKIFKRNKFIYYFLVYLLFGLMVYVIFTSRFLRSLVKEYTDI